MTIDPDKGVNEDPYAFTWVYPVLLLTAFVAFWFGAMVVIAICLMFAAALALSMGLLLGRHLLPLGFATVRRDKHPRLFWAYTFIQGVVTVGASVLIIAILADGLG